MVAPYAPERPYGAGWTAAISLVDQRAISTSSLSWTISSTLSSGRPGDLALMRVDIRSGLAVDHELPAVVLAAFQHARGRGDDCTRAEAVDEFVQYPLPSFLRRAVDAGAADTAKKPASC